MNSDTRTHIKRSEATYLSFINAMESAVKRAATIASGLLRNPSPVVTIICKIRHKQYS
jgi:hypothetical protein